MARRWLDAGYTWEKHGWDLQRSQTHTMKAAATAQYIVTGTVGLVSNSLLVFLLTNAPQWQTKSLQWEEKPRHTLANHSIYLKQIPEYEPNREVQELTLQLGHSHPGQRGGQKPRSSQSRVWKAGPGVWWWPTSQVKNLQATSATGLMLQELKGGPKCVTRRSLV